MVEEDGRQRVGGRDPARREVEAASLAKPGGAAVARPADGPVEHDETVPEREARRAERVRRAVEEPPPWPLPPLPPSPAPPTARFRAINESDTVRTPPLSLVMPPPRPIPPVVPAPPWPGCPGACCGRRWRSRTRRGWPTRR